MSHGPRENRPRCRSAARIFTRSVICRFRSLFSQLFRCFFGTAGSKKPEFMRLSEVRPLYFPDFISGISERSEASKSEGWAERCARPAQQGLKPTPGSSPHQSTDLQQPVNGDDHCRQKAGPLPGGKDLLGCHGYPSRDPHHTGGCPCYAAALRKYWEIPTWRRAIASTSPLSVSLSSA